MRKLIFILIACLPLAMQAQDFHWSHIHMNPVYLNPAFTGFANKANRITGLYRDQWRSVPVPYSTTHIAYDRRLFYNEETGWRLGLGGQLLYDQAGDGALSTFRPALNLGVGKYFNKGKQLINLGMQGAWARKQIDFSKLTFDTQYDGVIYNPGLDPGEVIAGDNASYLDLGAGINFQSKVIKEKGLVDIGFSAFNLTRPGYTFLSGANAEVAPRMMVYGKADLPLGAQSAWSFMPGVFYQIQESAQQTLFQGLFSVGVGKANEAGVQDVKLTFGPGYRLGDAVVGFVGFVWKDLKVSFAFDGNTSDFNVATRGRGAYELAVNYEWERKKKEPVPFPDPVVEEEEEEEELVVEEITEVAEEPVAEQIDPISPLERLLIQLEADLKVMPPIRLFFDNDQPNPRTRQTTTDASFGDAVAAYRTVKPTFVEMAGDDFVGFFNDNVQTGFDELNATLGKFETLLANGKSIELELKGFASPLAGATYNQSLTERRIASIENYLMNWNNGALKPYIESGTLAIARNPVGDTKANQAVSDDRKDIKNSVYSIAASFERRVELMIKKVQ